MSPFSLSCLPSTPWKNGGGTTREVLSWPEGGEFDWRASVATIGSSGSFSAFPGVDRTIVLIEGDGVRLRSKDDGIDHRLDQPLASFSFPGEEAIYATLLGGPSIDFNLMVRRGRLRALLQILTDETDLDPARHGLLLSLTGNWRLRVGRGEVQCAEHQGLWWADIRQGVHAEPKTANTEAGANLLAIRLDPL